MGEWLGEKFDDLKQEFYWPYEQAKNWYADSDNRFATWFIIALTAVMSLVVYIGAQVTGKWAWQLFSDNRTLTIQLDNPCLTDRGLIKEWAPAPCYDSGHKHTVAASEAPATDEERIKAMTRNNDASVTPTNENAYKPPCFNGKVKDGGCTDKVYAKRYIYGVIDEVTFKDDEAQTDDGHLQPDYTEVAFFHKDVDDSEQKEKFCGNVLDKFTPGEAFNLVLNESKQSDYNGCYMVEVVRLTFGGDYYRPRKR